MLVHVYIAAGTFWDRFVPRSFTRNQQLSLTHLFPNPFAMMQTRILMSAV
jgi:hypothetical protein